MATIFRDRMLDFRGGLFGSPADEILRFVRSTRPRHSADEVEVHIAWLDREGLVSERNLATLGCHGYRV